MLEESVVFISLEALVLLIYTAIEVLRLGHCPPSLGCCGLGDGAHKGSALICELLAQNLLLPGTYYNPRPP